MIEIEKVSWPELGLDCAEVKTEKGILQFVLDQLEAERMGWA